MIINNTMETICKYVRCCGELLPPPLTSYPPTHLIPLVGYRHLPSFPPSLLSFLSPLNLILLLFRHLFDLLCPLNLILLPLWPPPLLLLTIASLFDCNQFTRDTLVYFPRFTNLSNWIFISNYVSISEPLLLFVRRFSTEFAFCCGF